MKWNKLTSAEQLKNLVAESTEKPILIFKHSTRCSISAATLDRLERNWNETEMASWQPYYLDLIAYREVSNAIEHMLGVEHESPQAIVLHKGGPVYDASHFSISYQDIRSAVPPSA